MAPASNEEQFKFLISCIRWSNSGKVDFGEVAKECSIVSKGAAAKRYERMMKAHGIAPNAASARASPAARTFKTERKENSSVAKKRKMDDFPDNHRATADDDENFDKVKSDPGDQAEELQVKQESCQTLHNAGENSLSFMPSQGSGSQDYLHADGIFEQDTASFTNHGGQTSDGNIYSLPHESGFMPFNAFEQSSSNDDGSTDIRLEDHHQDSILIAD